MTNSEKFKDPFRGEAEILAIRQQIATMGANDSEFEDIQNILNKLRGGEIDYENAMAQANLILSSRQDYH